jgi:hypothetical protein
MDAYLLSVPTVRADQQSPNFEAIAQHLDLRGQVYGYIDIEGDLEGIAHQLNTYLEPLRATQSATIPANLDLQKIVRQCGLTDEPAIGRHHDHADDPID